MTVAHRSLWSDGEGGERSGSTPKRALLEPFSLTVEMMRNLSAAWFTGMPTIDIAARLDAIQVSQLSVWWELGVGWDCVSFETAARGFL